MSSLLFERTPAAWHPYLRLARLDRPIGIWLLLLPGLWSLALAAQAQGGFDVNISLLAVLFAFGAVIMRGAGCVINDLCDRKLDAAVARTKTRPLAAGTLKPWQALCFLAALLTMALAILLLLNRVTIVLGILSLVLVAAYPLMKRVTWWPQAFLGLTFNWGALMGWSAATGGLAWPAFCLYAAGIAWTLAYDTIYAHQDKEDDALAGIKSTARLFGTASRKWVACFFAIALGFIFIAGAGLASVTPWLLLPAAAHAVWQVWRWNMDDPDSCLKIFKSNRDFGLLVLLYLCV